MVGLSPTVLEVDDVKRWIAGIAAVGLIVGVGGPVAAKAGSSAKAPKSAAVASAEPTKKAPIAAAPVVLPKSHNSGGYPGPRQPKVEVEPDNPRRNRSFKVEVEYFCRRGTVTVDIAPSVADWPKTITTDRYGKGKVYVRSGISTSGNYSITATCGSDTATVNFRVR